MQLLDNFWPKELRGYFRKALKVYGQLLHNRPISEFAIFLEHVCKVQPLELRIHRIPRTRVQSAAVRAPNLWYSSNTCAKCCRLSSEFIVFLEHVCKVLPFELRICGILRTRVQSAAVRAPNSSSLRGMLYCPSSVSSSRSCCSVPVAQFLRQSPLLPSTLLTRWSSPLYIQV